MEYKKISELANEQNLIDSDLLILSEVNVSKNITIADLKAGLKTLNDSYYKSITSTTTVFVAGIQGS